MREHRPDRADPPRGIAAADATTAAWHFRIVGKTVTVGEGEIIGADMNVRADYESVLSIARLVYTPEILANMERNRPQADGASTAVQARPPSYLVQLHNRLAAVTG